MERLGSWCEKVKKSTDELGRLLVSTSDEIRSKEYFKQYISIAVGKGTRKGKLALRVSLGRVAS